VSVRPLPGELSRACSPCEVPIRPEGAAEGNGKRRHTGEIGITVHDDYTGRGIGRALLAALLDLADNTLGLKRVELDVITDNAAAIHLYESLGFEHEGIKRCALFRGGQFVDLLMMGRIREFSPQGPPLPVP
jgi:putative acetyltransferase